jgi:hypothetical protein
MRKLSGDSPCHGGRAEHQPIAALTLIADRRQRESENFDQNGFQVAFGVYLR